MDYKSYKSASALSFILVAYLILGVVYSITTPIFEPADEAPHLLYALYLTRTERLPVQNTSADKLSQWEAAQPPLYYIFIAPFVAVLPFTTSPSNMLNPHAANGLPHSQGNKNIFIHPTSEKFPWRGTALSIHLLRFVSLLLGAVTVWLTWKSAKELTSSKSVAGLASALVAFNPMFLFISASINNDNLVDLIGAVATLSLIRGIKKGFSTKRAGILGILVGLGVLTKLSALTFVPIAILGILLEKPLHKNTWSHIFRNITLFILASGMISCWWFARNLILYKDLTGFSAMIRITNANTKPLSLHEVLMSGVLRGFRYSYWGVFGGFNVLMGEWLYNIYDTIMIGSFLGFLTVGTKWWIKGERERLTAVLLLCVWVTTLFLALLHNSGALKGMQGRHLFVAISGISLLGATSVLAFKQESIAQFVSITASGTLLFLAAIVPLIYIRPAYTSPRLLTEDEIPAGIHRLNWVYDNTVELIGVKITPKSTTPGKKVSIEACWTVTHSTKKNYSVFVHVWDSGNIGKGNRLFNLNTYPGLGSWPTSQIPAGKVVCDIYQFAVPETVETPSKLAVEMGVYIYKQGTIYHLKSHDPHGNPITVGLVGYVGAVPYKWPSVPSDSTRIRCTLGDSIELVAYRLRGNKLTLYWKAKKDVQNDYKVFIHILDDTGHLIYQIDSMPMEGKFPTSLWIASSVIIDERTVPPYALTTGHSIEVGLYTPRSGQRLPVTCGDNIPFDKAIHIPVSFSNPKPKRDSHGIH